VIVPDPFIVSIQLQLFFDFSYGCARGIHTPKYESRRRSDAVKTIPAHLSSHSVSGKEWTEYHLLDNRDFP
jgi:hypothetical protein